MLTILQPWMAGIFAGSLFLIGFDWLFMVLPATAFGSDPVGISEGSSSHLLLNLLFAALFGLTTYFYSACMRFEPGFVPKMNGIAEQKAVIDELLAAWKYDEYNFCTACMIRTPLRSKHCKACQRCVAKHDQSVLPKCSLVTIYSHANILTVTAPGYTTVSASTTTATFSST